MSEGETKKNLWQWILKNSLWIVAGGLMLFSASFDGVYLETLSAITWFGYAINFFADIANPAMMYWYGRLQQDKYKAKREKSKSILVWERIAIAYSWLFSWRQLRGRVYLAEAAPLAAKLGGSDLAAVIEIELLAFAFAGFVPLMLAGVGALQALIAGRIETEATTSEPKAEPARAEPVAPVALPFQCQHCAAEFGTQAGLNAHQRAHKPERSNGHGVEVLESGKEASV
jgi:hypothetical protein